MAPRSVDASDNERWQTGLITTAQGNSRYGSHDLDIDRLLSMDRPGASEADIRKDVERQLRLNLEAQLCTRLGIPEKTLKTHSIDQLITILREATRALESARSLSHTSARLQSQASVPTASIQEPSEAVSQTPEKIKLPKTRTPRVETKRQVNAEIQEALDETSFGKAGLLNLLSNPFLNLQGVNYSPHDVYGAYLGNEARSLLDSARVRQEGDRRVEDSDLSQLKRSEMVKAFTISSPEEFFRIMFKFLGLNKDNGFDVEQFFQARTKLLNAQYRPLKDSLRETSTVATNNLSGNVVETLRKELELRNRILHRPSKDNGQQLHTKGISSSFVSRLKEVWRDHDLNLDRSRLAAV